MALKTAPTDIGFAQITLSAMNAVATSESPFTYKQQIVQHTGQAWRASITIPPVRRDLAEPWVAFLLSLQGPVHTFLLGDPNCTEPRGTATNGSITATGTSGATAVTLTISDGTTLKAGDYIQLGTSSTSKLHKVLADISTTGSVDIWPSLKATYSAATVTVDNAKGVFRLVSNVQEWQIGNSNSYGISFDAAEVIT
tara:strand:- start:54 stop:644 length:591 start_codon:yes stop_codon:yes gene_type:complete